MIECQKRSIAKTISFRLFATIITVAIVFAFTGELLLSFGIGIVEIISKTILYYWHERIWAGTEWGKTDTVQKK